MGVTMDRKSLYETPAIWKQADSYTWMCHLCFAVTYQEHASEHLQWHTTQDEILQDRLQEQLATATVELLKVLGGIRD